MSSEKNKFAFFWGGGFSNFHPADFIDGQGVKYNCTEQYYMSKKALFFEDSESHYKIMSESNPKKQKKLGRAVLGFSESAWYGEGNPAKKYMFEGNYLKYSQNDHLKKSLLTTVGRELVEASPYDSRWGVGMSVEDLNINNKSLWKGTNWLGEVLTEVREKLIFEENRNFLF